MLNYSQQEDSFKIISNKFNKYKVLSLLAPYKQVLDQNLNVSSPIRTCDDCLKLFIIRLKTIYNQAKFTSI